MGMGIDSRRIIAKRAAQEVTDGMIVNLGIGIPSLIPEYVAKDVHVMFHAENGILGMGPSPGEGKEDPALCNAGGFPITLKKGASYFDSATAFGMIRGGYIDLSVLGGLEVSQRGDLANWIVPGKRVPGIGGGMELACKSKKVVVVMSHVDKWGKSKIVSSCSLPLTAKECVSTIITDMAVIAVTDKGLCLTEVMYPYTVPEVIEQTDAPLFISQHLA
ncbi:3-oxoacid CoA-transferase subunit B [Thalassobacillus sp. C254]|uniref:3-oxoacid CoA-transferase subunit B n=1 Tax=Thalassobacillus sp. C254 TaxID=1225341 RepID=UPI0006CF4565|nr:3-oxoacid CoA-transferase subunit B [Thalassobacillus sp. C254]